MTTRGDASIRGRYAKRGAVERENITLVLPSSVIRYIRLVAEARGKSISSTATELLESAMNAPNRNSARKAS